MISTPTQNMKINGIYLAVDYHLNTDFILNRLCKELGIIPDNGYDEHYNLRKLPNGEEGYKFHTTIIYSKFKVPKLASDPMVQFPTKNGSTIFQKRKPKIQTPIKIIGVGFFDTQDGLNFHIKVESPFLRSEFRRAIQFGLPTDFPNYQPHITIKNNVPKEFKDFILNGPGKEIVKKYVGGTLYTNDEYIELLD